MITWRLVHRVRRWLSEAHGATAAEYALLGSLVAAVVAASVVSLGDKVKAMFELAVSIFG